MKKLLSFDFDKNKVNERNLYERSVQSGNVTRSTFEVITIQNGKKGFNISYLACLENAYFVRDYHLA